jgi:hypothetical protein
MERLNSAASAKAASILTGYSALLAVDIAHAHGLDAAEVSARCADLLAEFVQGFEESKKPKACSWFTKRGEPCNKDRRPGSEFCSVHAEYFQLHADEIARAKVCPERVNVTRKGIHKTCCERA